MELGISESDYMLGGHSHNLYLLGGVSKAVLCDHERMFRLILGHQRCRVLAGKRPAPAPAHVAESPRRLSTALARVVHDSHKLSDLRLKRRFGQQRGHAAAILCLVEHVASRQAQRGTSSSQRRNKELAFLTPDKQEVIPEEIKAKVLAFGRPVVAIEMDWSESGITPGHLQKSGHDPIANILAWGAKYRALSDELTQLLAPVGVRVVAFRTPTNLRRQTHIYDRYSMEDKRRPSSVASNVSFTGASPSRIGAFEVHVVQNTWDAERCCPGLLGNSQHRGPPVNHPNGLFCSACAGNMPSCVRNSET